jgi:hypothetical protein
VALCELGLWAVDKAFCATFQIYAWCVGFYDYHLPDMKAVVEVAAPYYDNDLRGGEGYMEVGKLILNVVKNKANMTLSVKPFGCMPSSGVSDGVQSLITEKFPGTIFCAVETSGDGAVNFYSRVQMYMFKAKQVAQAEVDAALARHGLTIEQVRDYLAKHPDVGGSLHHPPHVAGCTSADLIDEVGRLAKTTRLERTLARARSLIRAAGDTAAESARLAPARAKSTVLLVRRAGGELAEIAREKAPGMALSLAERAKSRVAKIVPLSRATSAMEDVPVAAE